MLTSLIIYLCLGAVTGFLAGLLGLGGGIVIVPMLSLAFSSEGMNPDFIQRIAQGTSLACMIFTSFFNAKAQNKKKAIRFDIVKNLVPGIFIGTVLGGLIAAKSSAHFLQIFFTLFLLVIGTQMFINIEPNPKRQLPKKPILWGSGTFIGIISSLVGIGGGSMSVPYMIYFNVQPKEAIGTSACLALFIAVIGTGSYVLNGIQLNNLPEYCFGLVHIVAFLGISATSILTVTYGVKTAHKLSPKKLKQIFGLFLLCATLKMGWSLF